MIVHGLPVGLKAVKPNMCTVLTHLQTQGLVLDIINNSLLPFRDN